MKVLLIVIFVAFASDTPVKTEYEIADMQTCIRMQEQLKQQYNNEVYSLKAIKFVSSYCLEK